MVVVVLTVERQMVVVVVTVKREMVGVVVMVERVLVVVVIMLSISSSLLYSEPWCPCAAVFLHGSEPVYLHGSDPSTVCRVCDVGRVGVWS